MIKYIYIKIKLWAEVISIAEVEEEVPLEVEVLEEEVEEVEDLNNHKVHQQKLNHSLLFLMFVETKLLLRL